MGEGICQRDFKPQNLVESLIRNKAFPSTHAFRYQLERATLSISSNIAEGFERGTTKELIHFLYIARGSSGEVRSLLTLKLQAAAADDADPELAGQLATIIATAESCSKQLRAWANMLQASKLPGQRHLTRSKGD